MSEILLQTSRDFPSECRPRSGLQGYLTDKKTPTPGTLPKAYAYGPVGVLGGGRFLMGEVPQISVGTPLRPGIAQRTGLARE